MRRCVVFKMVLYLFADGRVRKDDALCPAFTASQSEVDLRVHFKYLCARGCAERHAYVSVVASM